MNENLAFDSCPFTQFAEWFDAARGSEINDPNAMALATVAADGTPRARIVLLKSHGPDGFCFFTNTESNKGQELAQHPRAALCFHWKTLQRQVRILGEVKRVPDDESDDYFASRFRVSQLGAWASMQSRPLDSMVTLTERLRTYEKEYHDQPVPRPPHWGGYALLPDNIEFWAERPHRLHERVVYTRAAECWEQHRLYP